MYERSTGAPEPRERESLSRRLPPGFDPHAQAGTPFVPNSFSVWARICNVFLSLVLLLYGGLGVWLDDLFIPGKRTDGIHFHGAPAWLMYGAMTSGAAVMLSVVADHYDKRNNEERYVSFRQVASLAGWVFFAVSLGWCVLAALNSMG